MDVTIVLLFPAMRPHFETSLELAQRHLDAGDRVTLLTCEACLAGCDGNPEHATPGCLKCIDRRRQGVKLLAGDFRTERLGSWVPPSEACPLPEVASVDELMQVEQSGFDWGMAVASTLISEFRDPRFSLHEHRDVVQALLRGSWQVYRGICRYLESRSCDAVYVFNGRYSTARAVFRACRQRGVECRIHERGATRYQYYVCHDALPHDHANMERRIRQVWQDAEGKCDREEVARQWYLARAGRQETNWKSFVSEQNPDQLPPDWGDHARRLVLFTSSEDEVAAIGESWHHGCYSSQLEGLERVAADWNQRRDAAHLWIRVHPNSAQIPSWYHEAMGRLVGPNVSLIGPQDKVDTYAMMRQADTVLAFSSTVGIEAVFWGRPSILIGNSFYKHLGSTYQPNSHQELIELMGQDLKPLSIEPALVYGFHWATYGERYRHFEPAGMFRGTFRGRQIRPTVWTRLRVRWEKLLRSA